ncbi:MAG: hypothetical protein ACRD2B_10255 [Terriglobia bacterium]
MRRTHFACALAILVFIPAVLLSQSSPLSSPQATALVSQAIQASAGSASLTDITLQAQATYIAGSDQETGTAHDWVWFGMGAFCLLAGLFGRNWRWGALHTRGKPMPTWLGRTLTLALAAFCFFMGIKSWH